MSRREPRLVTRSFWHAGSRRSITAVLALSLGFFFVLSINSPVSSDTGEGGDFDGWMNYVDYYAGGSDVIEEIRAGLLADLDEANGRIEAAISELDDPEIERALIDAADRGVSVRIVSDELHAQAEGFEALVAHDDISVVFGDGELAYLPEPNLSPILEYCDGHATEHDDHINCTRAGGGLIANNDRVIVRPPHYNVMSHTFFVVDETVLWNITAPLTEDQQTWFAFRALSEEMANSFEREFRQMHGGVFATTLSVYNGPLKSVTHQSPLRFTNRGQLRVRFNPQERLTKNIVDETYRARASVFVMTENLTNTDLIDALNYKNENGFDVRLIVGQGQATTLQDEIEPLNPVVAPESMGSLPTVVILDSQLDRRGNHQPRQVQILSHELLRAQPFEVIRRSPSDQVRFYPSDTFADGVLWEIVESGSQRNPAVEPFVEVWEELWSQANDG